MAWYAKSGEEKTYVTEMEKEQGQTEQSREIEREWLLDSLFFIPIQS